MSKYDIKSWNPIMYMPNNNMPFPMIYIKPDDKFLNLLNSNFILNVTIGNTNTIYDGKEITGIVLPHNFRPNFTRKTGFRAIVLVANWYEYPKLNHNGYVIIQGISDIKVNVKPKQNTDIPPIKNPKPSPPQSQLKQKQHTLKDEDTGCKSGEGFGLIDTLSILAILIVIICILYILFNYNK